MPTPHISADDGAFAPIVLMPGDPLRATYIAEEHLDAAQLVTNVRSCSGYTGSHQGVPVSVMASGMGMPSAAIYITELYRFYGVETIMRVGTSGVFAPDMDLRSIVVADSCVTNSAMPELLLGDGYAELMRPSADLLALAHSVAAARGLELHAGTIFSSDIFYEPDEGLNQRMGDDGVLAVEMETAVLYSLAVVEQRRALAVMTTTDHLICGEHLTAEERQTTLDEMIAYALAIAVADSGNGNAPVLRDLGRSAS
ncbi:MAG: purine-nucleoside phosphorylase [Actinomycetota bacterium]|nr:purine-nucleoside phosphorylase [Actinomycetota bacterium]